MHREGRKRGTPKERHSELSAVPFLRRGPYKPTIVSRGVVSAGTKDAYWEKCPADKRH